MGVLYHYMAYGCIEYLFSIGIGYGKYAYGVYAGAVNSGDLCCIYHIDNSGDEARCGLVLDFGTCLRRIPAYLLQYISASRKMEIEEDIKMNTDRFRCYTGTVRIGLLLKAFLISV